MKLISIPLILYIFFYTSLAAQDLVVINANLIDVASGRLIKNQDILVRDGIITEIGRSLKYDSEEVVDGKGKFVIPGLIDAHMHLFQSGGLYARPDAIDLTVIKSYDNERAWTFQNAEDILNRYTSLGITSVIDLGGPSYQFGMRDSLNRETNSATVFMTGPLISSYVPDQLKVNYPPIIKVDSIAGAVDLVRQQADFGADFIKIWYIAFKPQDALDFYPLVESICKEAKRLGLPVAVHAKSFETAKLAIRAGARFLVHSVTDVEIDDEFLELLRKSKAIYCPTLQVSKNYDDVFLDEYSLSETDFAIANPITLASLFDVRLIEGNENLNYYRKHRSATREMNRQQDSIQLINMKKLLSEGLPIALGTDAGNIGTLHASSFYREIQLFKDAGMSEVELLKAMTIHPAEAINVQNQIGTLSPNKRADILVLNSNPLEKIESVKDIHMIIKAGEIVDVNSLIRLDPETLVQKQLNAYNGHSVDAFIELFAEDVKVFDFPNKLLIEGKEQMRQEYQFLSKNKDAHRQLINRIVNGTTVIDYENVIVDKNKPALPTIVLYKVKGQKIQEVYFVK